MSLPDRPDLTFRDLRSLAVSEAWPRGLIAILAQAKSVLHWHERHRFCAACGSMTRVSQSGWRRDCPSCGAQHFPRVDPVAIMLAVHGETCLLGRQPGFPPGMYSCLAGFVEPGETLEEAVRRELLEEAGVACGRVAYAGSQPWPFPSSLMLGALAAASSPALVVDRAELEDARWFGRGEAVALLEGRHPQGWTAPAPVAIAHHILRAWAVDGRTP